MNDENYESKKTALMVCPIQSKVGFYPKDRFSVVQPVRILRNEFVLLHYWLQRKFTKVDRLVVNQILEFIPNCKCKCHNHNSKYGKTKNPSTLVFGNCDFLRICNNQDHIFCECASKIFQQTECGSVSLHDILLYNDYQSKHMPDKWLITGTQLVQQRFLSKESYQTTTAPHIRAIENYEPNSCGQKCVQKKLLCRTCEKYCCNKQHCKCCYDYLHAECGLFVYDIESQMMKTYCKLCVKICIACKEYIILYQSPTYGNQIRRQISPQDPPFDLTCQNNAGVQNNIFTNYIFCEKCFFENCSRCKKSVKRISLVYCAGCKLKICQNCDTFSEVVNISFYHPLKQAILFCSNCIDNASCTVCHQKDTLLNLAQCYECETWNCLSNLSSCTITLNEGKYVRSEPQSKYICRNCDKDSTNQKRKKLE